MANQKRKMRLRIVRRLRKEQEEKMNAAQRRYEILLTLDTPQARSERMRFYSDLPGMSKFYYAEQFELDCLVSSNERMQA